MTDTQPLIAKEDGTQRKSIYQSDLVRHSGLLVMLTGDPIPSKYPKDGISHCAFLKLADGLEYTLAVENEVLEDFRSMPRNQWLRLEAGGSRDEPATISATTGEAPPNEFREPEEDVHPHDMPAATPAPTVSGSTGVDLLASSWAHAARIVDAGAGASVGAVSPDARLDAICRIAVTLFIQASR